MKKLTILLWLIAFCYSVKGQTKLSLEQKWSFDSYGEDLGLAGLITSDIDKNGRPEVIVSAIKKEFGQSPLAVPLVKGFFSVVEFNPLTNRYEPKWTSRLFDYEISEIQVNDLTGDGIDEIFIGFISGEIKVLSGLSFKEIYSFYTAHSTPFDNAPVTSIAFGDIDNDGTKNIVATNGDVTYIFSTAFQLIRTITIPGGTITLANIDQDEAIESIYTKGQVIQYTSLGQVNEFRFYPLTQSNGYNETVVRIADMNLDGIKDIIYSSRDSVYTLDIANKVQIGSIKIPQSSGTVSDFQLHDYTLDGVPDFFIGCDGFTKMVHVYNGATSAFAYSLEDFSSLGVASLVIGEFDDALGADLFTTIGANCSCDDHFFVFDVSTRSKKWKSKFREGSILAFNVGNVDNNEIGDELVVGSFGAYASVDKGLLDMLSLNSKTMIREIENPFFSGSMGLTSYSSMEIGDVNLDGNNEIVLGLESNSNSETRVYVLDKNFAVLQFYDIDGMSLVTDIAIADVDNDGLNEVIVACGTNVTGSSNSSEWQNYIYIFDGSTGNIEWKSEQLAGIGSRIGNIKIANIDDDPSVEIISMRYNKVLSPSLAPSLYVIDGTSHIITSNSSYNYNSFDVFDFDKDGMNDIIAGTLDGKVVVLDGESFELKKLLSFGSENITSLLGFDWNGDGFEELTYTNSYKLKIFDATNSTIIAQTDTLGSQTGQYGSLLVNGSGPEAEIFVTSLHDLFSFKLEMINNVKPTGFNLLSPSNQEVIHSNEQFFEFLWENALDDEPVSYAITLAGNGLDTIISSITTNHISIESSLFDFDVPYTWSVTASDGYDNTISPAFTFVKAKLSQVISFNSIEDKNSDDPDFQLVASASSGLPISFETDTIGIISISDNVVSIIGSGPVSISAFQEGNMEFNAAEPVTRTFMINLVLRIEDEDIPIRLYPNPTTGIINFNLEHGVSIVSILNVLGKRETVELNTNSADLGNLTPGVYMIKLKQGSKEFTTKVIKQ